MKPELYVFAKRADMGRSKTRLAHDIGPVHAQRLYRAMTTQILRNVQDPRWTTCVYGTPDRAIGHVPDWAGFPQRAQPAGSLTPRLADLFYQTPRRPVIVIGTDCPQVRARDIAAAIRALKTAPFVFGPARDGGFWLMGAISPLKRSVFDGVRWSSAQTLSDLEDRLSGSIVKLHDLTDVDDADGLDAWRQSS
jgi:hypothetical protein